jgi:hypothetical protein
MHSGGALLCQTGAVACPAQLKTLKSERKIWAMKKIWSILWVGPPNNLAGAPPLQMQAKDTWN